MEYLFHYDAREKFGLFLYKKYVIFLLCTKEAQTEKYIIRET